MQFGPSGRTDSRHRISLSAVVQLPAGIQLAPIYRYRSALPVTTTEGVDLNGNGTNNDIPSEAFAFDGFDGSHNPITKDLGACTHINCARGTSFSQMNLRVSKAFHLVGTARVEAIGEVFNLFNSINPSGFIGRRFLGTITSKSPNPDFLRPTAYAGDFQQPEQRIGQIGLRFTF